MTAQTRPPPAPGPGRRTVLNLGLGLGLGAVTGFAVTGCELNNPLTEEETPAAEAVRNLVPDVAVAVEAATLVRGARSAVVRTQEQHAPVSARLAGLVAMHDAHLRAVVDA